MIDETLVKSQLLIIALYDYKSDTYGLPVAIESVLEAKRSLEMQVKNPMSKISMFPTDFGLFHIGYFYKNTGKILPLDEKQLICNAVDFPHPTQNKG